MNEHTIVNEHTILNEHSHQNGHIYLNGCAPDNKLMFESPSEHTNDDSHIITNGHTSANGHIQVNRHTSANGHATLSNLDTVEKHRFLNGLSHENGRIERPDHETAYVYMYFINDGLFGTFSNVRTDQLVARPSFLKVNTFLQFSGSSALHDNISNTLVSHSALKLLHHYSSSYYCTTSQYFKLLHSFSQFSFHKMHDYWPEFSTSQFS